MCEFPEDAARAWAVLFLAMHNRRKRKSEASDQSAALLDESPTPINGPGNGETERPKRRSRKKVCGDS